MINLHRIPDRITLLTQEGSIQHAGDFLVKSPAAILQCDLQADRLHILLTGFETPLYSVRLRWNIKLPERLQLLGDHWERGYGDLSWRGYVPERVMPWYFIAAAEGGRTAGCGVMVQPDALAFWQVDPSGVTLTLDVRCGGEGVTLGGKTIAAATVRCGCWQDITPYEAAEHTAAMLCERPLHPDHPVRREQLVLRLRPFLRSRNPLRRSRPGAAHAGTCQPPLYAA